ncbi:MAG TPA: excinuclease ABC subunit UvrA [Anaerolineae bacterium]|nr:excinuclease ABC subunit UvrA [Anaerolineae bacterium]HQI87425.1 excinuclease ABC subunit UvrA [Anaerolineae bacterium]
MRDTITVQGAKEHNLKNITVEIPRNQLVVITGVSGSGKSSLAFDTVYAEGQRRFLESMSTFAKKYIAQLKKPNVDFVFGLSPVISIEQKTGVRNPRSTVGTMTDIYDYLRMLYATIGVAHCPYCGVEVPVRSAEQLLDHLLTLPVGTEVEIRAPVFKIYGEDYAYLFDQVRTRGYRRAYIDGHFVDFSEPVDLDEDETYQIDVIVDRFPIKPGNDKQILASLKHGLLLGEGFISLHILDADERRVTQINTEKSAFICENLRPIELGCLEHNTVMGEMEAQYFSFNLPSGSSSCVTCLGLGTYRSVHPELLVLDPHRSIAGGALAKEAINPDKNSWSGRMVYSLAQHYGFSLDTPFKDLPPEIVDLLFYGTKGAKFPIVIPPGAKTGERWEGREMSFGGIIAFIERNYRRYRKEGRFNTWMDEWLKKVMVEHTCPDCGGKRLKPQRFLVTVDGKNIHELGDMAFADLVAFLEAVTIPEKKRAAGTQIVREIVRRVRLLLDIGVDYLTLNRPSNTLSGGESQRIRLSTQIGSDLMGMLYVLDEPTIGLHPYDTRKMVETLHRLRDLGNSVIVVEHDEAIIRAADTLIEMGPGPGLYGGEVVTCGPVDAVLRDPASLTGQYIEGAARIALPEARRSPNGHNLVIRGAQENNLRDLDVTLPLGLFICVTGVSGSGKSSLIHEILYKKLYATLHDHRVLPGKHRALEGVEYVTDIVDIDQSPIGRTPRSNPATYIGVYDAIRQLFADTPEAQARGYGPSRFSFNVKEGHCAECAGEGYLNTHLQFMADVETICPVCKGARYNAETLEVTYRGKSIADVLDLSIEEAVAFFEADPFDSAQGKSHVPRSVVHKLRTLRELGLGYLKVGHPATKLSGGEAQRVKLAHELGKMKRGAHNLYILDEPTTGLHAADIEKLLVSLNRLVDAGHTVLVIEHHLDVIKTADWIIDLGPDGGEAGGRLVAQGTPEAVAMVEDSYTGRYLKTVL